MKVNEAEKTSTSLIDTAQRDVLKIDAKESVSPDALLMALAYEGDLFWMKRNCTTTVGDLGLQAPRNVALEDLATINTDRLTRSRKNIEKAIQISRSVLDYEERVANNIFRQFGLSLKPDELETLAGGFELGEEFTPFSVLLALAPSREASLELSRAYTMLTKVEKSPERIKMATSIQSEIARSGIDAEEIYCVVGIPVIGFGSQSSIFEQTIKCLDKMEIPEGALVVFNVNLPADKMPDNTFASIQEYVANKRLEGRNFIAVQSLIEGKVMMGDIRSAIFDGFLSARKESLNCMDVIFMSTDDDNISMSKNWIIDNKKAVLGRDTVAVTPVSFSGLADGANENFPNFMLSENLRCMVADYVLSVISKIDGKQIKSLQEMQWLVDVVFGGKAAGYIESVVLSTTAFSAQKYLQVGGYPPQDEITKFTRLVVLDGLLRKGFTGLYPLSNVQPVLTDNRRQLAAYLADGASPVAAWKNPGTRFQADEVDPVRTNKNADTDTRVTANQEKLGELDLMLSQTFYYMGIGNPELAKTFLADLGINTEKVNVEVYTDGSLGFSFQAKGLQELYD